MTAFPRDRLDALTAAIEVNDRIDATVAAPVTVRLDYTSQLIDGFHLSRQLWREDFDRAALIGMTRTLGRGDPFGAEAQRRFKHVRATFKHLRFAFVLYGAEHRCPLVFKGVTTTMGALQDAFRNGRRGRVVRHAAGLRLLLSPVPMALLAREVDRFVPDDPAGFRRFVVSQMATLRTLLACDTITDHAFHAARKIVSRQVSFHDDMRTLAPDPAHDAMARYLAAINGSMGRLHDDLVARGDHGRGEFPLPPDIRARLTALVALYPAG